jgi:hypothetical protein
LDIPVNQKGSCRKDHCPFCPDTEQNCTFLSPRHHDHDH